MNPVLFAFAFGVHVFFGTFPPFNAGNAFNLGLAAFWFGMLFVAIADRIAKPSGMCPNQSSS